MSEERGETAGGGPPPRPCTSLSKTPLPPVAPVPVVSSSPLTSVPSSFALALFAPPVPALPGVSGGAPPWRLLLETSLYADDVSRPLRQELLPPSRASLPSSSCSSDDAPSSLASNPHASSVSTCVSVASISAARPSTACMPVSSRASPASAPFPRARFSLSHRSLCPQPAGLFAPPSAPTFPRAYFVLA